MGTRVDLPELAASFQDLTGCQAAHIAYAEAAQRDAAAHDGLVCFQAAQRLVRARKYSLNHCCTARLDGACVKQRSHLLQASLVCHGGTQQVATPLCVCQGCRVRPQHVLHAGRQLPLNSCAL